MSKLLHADHINRVLGRLIDLTEGVRPTVAEDPTAAHDWIQSHLANLGVCGDCLASVAMAWVRDNGPEVTNDAADKLTEEDIDELIAFGTAAWTRGFIVGLVMGRDNPI